MDSDSGSTGGPVTVSLTSNNIKLEYDKERYIQEAALRIFAAASFFDFDDNGKMVVKKDSQVQQIAKRSVRYAKLLADEVFS